MSYEIQCVSLILASCLRAKVFLGNDNAVGMRLDVLKQCIPVKLHISPHMRSFVKNAHEFVTYHDTA